MLTKLFAVAIGGALGSLARYAFNTIFATTLLPFPFATFFINITGSFAIGMVLSFGASRIALDDFWRPFLVIGFLGAYTTFSTFEFETFELVTMKQFTLAFFYVSLSFALGLIGVLVGVTLGKRF
jgi:CrcB protein